MKKFKLISENEELNLIINLSTTYFIPLMKRTKSNGDQWPPGGTSKSTRNVDELKRKISIH